MTPIRRIKKFPQAFRTGRNIGQNQRQGFPFCVARPDLEALKVPWIEARTFKALDGGMRWLVVLQAHKKMIHSGFLPLHFKENPLGIILYPAAKFHLRGKAVNEGTKSHALDQPTNDDASPFNHDDPAHCSCSQSHHAGMPLPVVQEVSNTFKEGLMLRAFCLRATRLQFT